MLLQVQNRRIGDRRGAVTEEEVVDRPAGFDRSRSHGWSLDGDELFESPGDLNDVRVVAGRAVDELHDDISVTVPLDEFENDRHPHGDTAFLLKFSSDVVLDVGLSKTDGRGEFDEGGLVGEHDAAKWVSLVSGGIGRASGQVRLTTLFDDGLGVREVGGTGGERMDTECVRSDCFLSHAVPRTG